MTSTSCSGTPRSSLLRTRTQGLGTTTLDAQTATS